MNLLTIFLIFTVALVQGSPLKPPPGSTDKLESFPWIKASKAKARFGTTPTPEIRETTITPQQPESVLPSQNPPLALTKQMLQDYVTSITASLLPYVVPDPPETSNAIAPPQIPPQPPVPVSTPVKRPLKGKVPKDVGSVDEITTTESYWDAERKMYPDSFYDEFYLDWLRKRQVEETPGFITPNPIEAAESAETPEVQAPQQPAGLPPQLLPSVPLAYNPYLMNPFLYPLAGMKVSNAVAKAQVNAALAALNITTTPKPVKIKLKIPIPPGSDLAQVVSSGIAGFPAGTTYELSKK